MDEKHGIDNQALLSEVNIKVDQLCSKLVAVESKLDLLLKLSSTADRIVGPSPTFSSDKDTDVGNSVSPDPDVVSSPASYSGNNSAKGIPQNNHDRGWFNYPRWNREHQPSSNSTADEEEEDTQRVNEDKKSLKPLYPDSHQLFVGNLPHTITKDELKDIFEVFGRVADVKILRPKQKQQIGLKVPFFSFVIFEEQSSAEAAIRDKSKISMKMYDGSHRRLNVEEKKKKRP